MNQFLHCRCFLKALIKYSFKVNRFLFKTMPFYRAQKFYFRKQYSIEPALIMHERLVPKAFEPKYIILYLFIDQTKLLTTLIII